MAFPRIIVIAAAALVTLGPTLAHAGSVTVTLDAPRYASLAALLHLPAPAPTPAPELVAEADQARHEAPCEEPDLVPPAQRWASAMRAFGSR